MPCSSKNLASNRLSRPSALGSGSRPVDQWLCRYGTSIWWSVRQRNGYCLLRHDTLALKRGTHGRTRSAHLRQCVRSAGCWPWHRATGEPARASLKNGQSRRFSHARSSRRRRGSRFERPCDGATIVTSRSVPRPDQGPQSRQLRGSASAARWEQVIPTGCTPLSERPGALAFSTRQPSGTAGKKPAAPSEKVRAGKLDKLKLSRGARSSPGGAA
jgi:hypothetical protein